MGKKKKIKINYHYEPSHSVYAVLGVIIILLLTFMINNYSKCRVYSLNSNKGDYKIANGILVMSNTKNILKLDSIKYLGETVNLLNIDVTLCVDVKGRCNSIYATSSTSPNGMDLAYYLDSLIIDINENTNKPLAMTKPVRKRIKNNLALQIHYVTVDKEEKYELIKLNVDTEYINNKIFY